MRSSSRLSFVLALLVIVPPLGAQVRKLNGPLARDSAGSLLYPGTSPDGRSLVYAVDPEGDGTFETRSAALDGKPAPVRLPDGAYWGFSRDGKRALLTADPDGDGRVALHSIAVDGNGPLVPLSGPFAEGGELQYLQASAAGVHVVYTADQASDEVVELHAVPPDGSAPPHRLSGALVAGGDVVSWVLSGDGRVAAYQADQEADELFELFVVPVDGSVPARKLALPLVPGGAVVGLGLDVDGARLVYAADQEEDERFELFSVRTDGSEPPRKLSGALVPDGDVGERISGQLYPTFLLSFDGRRVVYPADQEVDERFELFSVLADGSRAAVKLSRAEDGAVSLAAQSFDSAWAVYSSDPSGTDARELFSVPIDGSAPARALSGPMVAGGDTFFPQISFDSRFVLWEADQLADEVHELFGAPIDGSAPAVRVNGPLVPGGDLTVDRRNLLPGFWRMQAGVVYEADQEVDGLNELYFAPFPLGAPVRKLAAGPVVLPVPLAGYFELPPVDFGLVSFTRNDAQLVVGVEPGATPVELDALPLDRVVGDVTSFLFDPSGARALYQAREEGDSSSDLYSVSTGERRDAVQLHPEGMRIDNTILSPDGRWALYELGEEAPILFSAPADGSGAPRELYPDRAFDPVFTPDGERLVFRTDPGQRELYVVLLDGSAPALILSDTIPTAPAVIGRAAVSADSQWVAFRTSESKLYVAPLDDSLPAVQVSADGQLVIDDVQLSPDGASVFYRTDATGARKSELFVAPRDGSLAPLRLSGPIAGGGDVLAFDVTPDGARAVYLGEPQVADRQELLTVATDGGTPAVRLHAPLGASADVLEFELSPDGTRVVYRADSATDERFELFGVLADASQAPVRIGQSPVAGGGDVLDFRIASDSSCVVFRAAGATPATVDLFRATLRGGRSQRRIGQAPFAGGRVASFQLSADASTVAFTATRNAIGRQTLLAVPIGGEQKAVELAGPFTGSGSVLDYALSADGSLAAWRADQDQTGVVELFAAGVPSAKFRAAR